MDYALTITPAMQDYLEVVLELSECGKTVRVTDVAARLSIAKASVTQAASALRRMGLVTQDRYGPISLTPLGREEARKVRERHRVLRTFLVEVLGVNPKVAEKDACMMEHVVSPQTLGKVVEFLEDVAGCRAPATGRSNGEAGAVKPATIKNLAEMAAGESGKVIRVGAVGGLRRRILDMGITPGTEIAVKGVAPLGDPIQVEVRGYNLSLRKQEASGVFVEV